MLLNAILALSRLIRIIDSYKISKTSKTLTTMNESTLDLFCDHEDQKNEIDNAFDKALHELAEEQGVSLEYFMMEFI
jgi:hypothetical protein